MTLIALPPGGPSAPPVPSAPPAPFDPSGAPDPAAASLPPRRLGREAAESLGERIQQQAALIAAATCELLLMVAEFDERGALGWFVGLKSTAHWLSWACSMAPGTAREHVRVARALGEMPLTVAEFQEGRLSYSKVREMTRVAGRVEEAVLVEMARAMTAAQLSRTLASFRAIDGTRLGQDAERRASWHVREDGMVEVRAVLPAEIGAELMTALELALDRDGTAPPAAHAIVPESMSDEERAAQTTTTPTLEQRRSDALHRLARTYLDAEPDDRSGEDRHLVIVQVSADALIRDVPAGTPGAREPGTGDPAVGASPVGASASEDVPAGTSEHCGVLGAGPLEPATVDRLACTGKVSLMVTDAGGEVLHLGRAQRLASRAQRRALRLRDGTCVFPGCHQSKHLDAHHLIPWSEGGGTDIEGLALLCRRHHVMVHEGGMRLVADPSRTSAAGRPRLQVLDPAGRPVEARWPAMLEQFRLRPGPASAPTLAPPPGSDPDPSRIAATTGGFGFRLADCVDALCLSLVERAA